MVSYGPAFLAGPFFLWFVTQLCEERAYESRSCGGKNPWL